MLSTSAAIRVAQQRVDSARVTVAQAQRDYLRFSAGRREKLVFDSASADLIDAEAQLNAAQKAARLMETSALGMGAFADVEASMFSVTGLRFPALSTAIAVENAAQAGLFGLGALSGLGSALSGAAAGTYPSYDYAGYSGASVVPSSLGAPSGFDSARSRASADKVIKDSLEAEREWERIKAFESARSQASGATYPSFRHSGYSALSVAPSSYGSSSVGSDSGVTRPAPSSRVVVAGVRSSTIARSAGRDLVSPRSNTSATTGRAEKKKVEISSKKSYLEFARARAGLRIEQFGQQGVITEVGGELVCFVENGRTYGSAFVKVKWDSGSIESIGFGDDGKCPCTYLV